MSAALERAPLSKSQTAYRWLRQRITDQDFSPGHRLVLGSIARELDISVVPVREAIRQLEAEGLVTFERNVGAHVAMIDDSQYRFSMAALSILEAAATALSAPRLSVADLRRAREINTAMVDGLVDFDPRRFTLANQEFHAALFARCGNPRLLELVEAEWSRLAQLRETTFSGMPDRAHESVREHEQILDLIEGGAPADEIERAVRSHRRATVAAFLLHEQPGGSAGAPDLLPGSRELR